MKKTKREYQETDLSRFMRKVREDLGYSQDKVEYLTSQGEEQFRLSGGFLSQAEHGATPSPYKLLALARVYRIPITEFYRAIGASDEDLGLKPYDNAEHTRTFEQWQADCHELLDIVLRNGYINQNKWDDGAIRALFAFANVVDPKKATEIKEKLFPREKERK